MVARTRPVRMRKLTSDFVRGAALACIYHDEQLHNGVVDPWAPRLDDKDIFLADAGQYPDTSLSLGSQLVGLIDGEGDLPAWRQSAVVGGKSHRKLTLEN